MKTSIFKSISAGMLILAATPIYAEQNAIDTLMQEYTTAGASAGNAQRGEKIWTQTFQGQAPYTERSCTTCHSANLKNTGKHIVTGKAIEPLAPSANAKSLSDVKKIKKWFKRNCKWTLGQECSMQQKADILTFLKQH